MILIPGSWTFLILTFVTHSQAMLFSLDTTPDTIFCGRLHCWADKTFIDTNVFSVYVMTIYDVTQTNISDKLASLSVYDPVLDQAEVNITATGKISWEHAYLTIGLRDLRYCLNGSFLCELDFVHFNGHPDKIRETVSSEGSGNCPVILNQFAQVKSQVEELEKQNIELTQQIMDVRTELVKSTQRATCWKGMSHSNSTQYFRLWDKVAALCDTETDGGGWIVIHRRTKGDVDFYKGWADYKNGFGTPDTDFWIGNDVIHNLTSQGYTELRIDIGNQGIQYFAHYSDFYTAAEILNYRLSVSGYSGTAGDSLTYHDGRYFSTFDKDNDEDATNCASFNYGAWWYNTCYHSNLNGMWGAQNISGVCWDGLVTAMSVSMSEMKVRYG